MQPVGRVYDVRGTQAWCSGRQFKLECTQAGIKQDGELNDGYGSIL